MFGILFITLIFFTHLHSNLACTNQTTVSCSVSGTNVRTISVWRKTPSGICTSVQIGNSNFIFDPIMINYAWITLINTNKQCIQDITAHSEGIRTALGFSSSLEVVLLNVTQLYYRMVVVNRGCISNCDVIPFNLSQLSGKYSLYPIFNNLNQYGQFCLNNGVIDNTYTGAGYKCNCIGPNYLYGPLCEYTEGIFNTPLFYFNIFDSATIINLQFSIFSNGLMKQTNIITLRNADYQKIVELTFNDPNLDFTTEGTKTGSISIPKFDNQNWHDFSIIVTNHNATLYIDKNRIVLNLTSQLNADFRAFYLTIYEYNTTIDSVSIKNVISHGTTGSKVIDLNNPLYRSGCSSRCICSSTQNCNCRPFVSIDQLTCTCKPGYQPSGTTCVPNNVPRIQITDNVTAVFPINSVNLATVDFGFQTLSHNGTLLRLGLSSPSLNIDIQIVNLSLSLNVNNLRTTSRINFNVSNGNFHNVTLNVKTYSLEMILDNNYNYSSTLFNWYSTAEPTIIINSLTIGAMTKPFISAINNLTTCFSVIRLNSMGTSLDIAPSVNPLLATQCVSGPRCSSGLINCSQNQVCMDIEWQNTKCICIANFTSVNSTCTYNQCITNPCQNGSQCVYNSTIGNYSCICTNGLTGPDCSVLVASANLWWVAVLIVLILLLILTVALIVYCCCFRNRNPDAVPYIIKINENVVMYNDQAGECDYDGPPINFDLMQSIVKNNMLPTKNTIDLQKPMTDLMNKKEDFDKNNNDLILDHPLEYGFEGNDTENESVSSIGSKSVESQVDNMDNFDDMYNLTS